MVLTITLNPSVDRTIIVEKLLPHIRVFTLQSSDDPGGKGINTSKLLNSLNIDNQSFVISGGRTGEYFSQLCKIEKIDLLTAQIAQESRTNLTLITRQPHEEYKINEAGPVISTAEKKMILTKFSKLIASSKWMTIGGSLPRGLDESIYGKMISLATRAKCKVIVDIESASLFKKHGRNIFLIKPNRHELTRMTGKSPRKLEGYARAAQSLLSTGIENILLTLDAEGALWICREGVWQAKSPRVKIKSAIGAGDSTVAGAIAGWEQFARAPDALRLAVAAGTATAMMPGSSVGTAAGIQDLFKKISVRKLTL